MSHKRSIKEEKDTNVCVSYYSMYMMILNGSDIKLEAVRYYIFMQLLWHNTSTVTSSTHNARTEPYPTFSQHFHHTLTDTQCEGRVVSTASPTSSTPPHSPMSTSLSSHTGSLPSINNLNKEVRCIAFISACHQNYSPHMLLWVLHHPPCVKESRMLPDLWGVWLSVNCRQNFIVHINYQEFFTGAKFTKMLYSL